MADKAATKLQKVKPRWQLDFSSKSHGSDLPSPPGYTTASASLQAAAGGEVDPSLRIKRSWDVALGPFKQVITAFKTIR